jgi:ABC-type antimicrobial peptide transport system permease subunit
VNQTFVRQFLKGINPIGRTLRTVAEPNYPETEYEIVGVVKDAKYGSLREEIPPQSFAPATQAPRQDPWANLFVRFSSARSIITSAIRQKIQEISPEVRLEFHLFHTEVQNGLVRERLMALLSGFFGGLAVLLATIGLYGVVSYLVLRRRNEIGIRMALGASRYDVIGMVMRQALVLVGLGVVFGLPLSLALGKSARSLLFGMPSHDPITLMGAAGFLVIVSLLASYLPARRAARLSPMSTLHYE